MNIFEFMSGSPVLTFFIAMFAAQMVVGVFSAIFCRCDCSKDKM